MLAYQRQSSLHHLSPPSDLDLSSIPTSSHSLRYFFPDSFAALPPTAVNAGSSSIPSASSSSSSLSPSVATAIHHNQQQKTPRRPLPFALETTQPSNLADETYMTSTFDFSNPSIRVQQPTPVPQLGGGGGPYASSPLSGVRTDGSQNWNMYGSGNSQLPASPSLQTAPSRSGRHGHQRGTSSSSAGSNGSSAQYTLTYPYVVSPSSSCETSPSTPQIKLESSYQSADQAQRPFANHLPTPSQTPTQDSFLATTFPTYTTRPSSAEPSLATHMALKQALMDQNAGAGDEDVPGFGHSARQSVSSFGHESPATPHTAHGDDLDDKYKLTSNDAVRAPPIPKLNRTMTDIFQDELYIPGNQVSAPSSHHHHHQQQQQQSNSTLLSPYRNVVSERLQQAEQLRAQSPSSSISRDASPFRQGAVAYDGFGSPHPSIRTANAMRGQHQVRNDAFAMKQMNKMDDVEPKTISPKEAMLDYQPDENDAQMPLFPNVNASHTNNFNSQFGVSASQNLAGINATQGNMLGSDNLQTSSDFTFAAQPAMAFANMPQFSNSHNYRSASSLPSRLAEQTPDFPAHLTSMESSASEAGPPDSSQNDSEILRPESTLADSGTYSCTYHGCVLRFDSPQKLQRHKREAHRNAANTADLPAVGSGMTSAALLARNSQAGPHKCERINPTTGKPCNTVFSRPYDLTRHEDTIHNARKQKVRCALCVEEKTFSRNDALTRHMRVVHPEVDFPGKHRRRGGNHD